jgi:hypothetical protein
MKEFIKSFYQSYYKEDLVKVEVKECPQPKKTNRDKLCEFAYTFLNTDPTPKDEQPDEVACVHSLTTILNKYIGHPIMTYTPTFLEAIKKDARFKEVTEFKPGVIIISPTATGNGSIIGHTGIVGKGGKILSNASSTGLWTDKYDTVSWIDRYSRKGGLSLYLFELI